MEIWHEWLNLCNDFEKSRDWVTLDIYFIHENLPLPAWNLSSSVFTLTPFFTFLQNPRQTPPSWVPDADAQHCMGCHEQFTFVKRRHHCRACGKVFCSKCSSHFMALPQFGLDRPVRVCNRCDLLMNGTYDLSNHATSPTGTGSSSDNGPEMATSPTSGNTSRSPTQWNRYYGMVSWFFFLLFFP